MYCNSCCHIASTNASCHIYTVTFDILHHANLLAAIVVVWNNEDKLVSDAEVNAALSLESLSGRRVFLASK